MDHEAHVGALDSHAERARGHDRGAMLEGPLGLQAIGLGQGPAMP
jgi:hypothetical protein